MTTVSDETLKQVEDRQYAILNNIKDLQEMETSLYKQLETDSATSDTTNERAIVTKINELSTMRMTMFSDLDSMFENTQSRASQSRINLVDQLTAMGVMETELNNTKSNLNYLSSNKDNKMRMVEINTYYALKYQAQSRLMKLIILVCIPLLILAILAKKKFIPQRITNIIMGMIIVIGGFFIIKKMLNLSSRSNMNYDEFNWNWDPEAADVGNTSADNTASLSMGSGCIGSACCTTGMYYDSELGKCKSGTDSASTSLEGFAPGRSAVSYVEVPVMPCPFKQSKSVVKPYSENTYNYVKVSTR